MLGVTSCDLTQYEKERTRAENFTTKPSEATAGARDDALMNEEVVDAALRHTSLETLLSLKLVSRAWRERAREQLYNWKSSFWKEQEGGYRAYWDEFAREQTRRMMHEAARDPFGRISLKNRP